MQELYWHSASQKDFFFSKLLQAHAVGLPSASLCCFPALFDCLPTEGRKDYPEGMEKAQTRLGCQRVGQQTRLEFKWHGFPLLKSNFYFYYFYPHLRTWLCILERGEGREKGRERNIDAREKHQLVDFRMCSNWGLNCNPGMCP